MHIPDNYLSPATCAVLGAAMAPVWALSIKKVRTQVAAASLPLLGIGAAFSFLVMMLNIPLPGGTTGHAVGAVLIAALLGPWAACISVSVALLIQALLFGDGGILAFGANCFNMAFVMPFLGYFVYRFIAGRAKSAKAELVGLGMAAYLGLNAAALFAAIEFGLQPLIASGPGGFPLYCPYPLSVSIPAMLLPHLLVAGFVEALFTVGVFAFIKRASPGIISREAAPRIKPVYGLIVFLACLTPLGLLATGTAWGEWELAGGAGGFRLGPLFPDYSVSGLPEWAGYFLSAAAGAAILVIVFKLLARPGRRGRARA